MVYHHVTLGPSDGQMSDLAEGRTILLQHGDLSGDVSFHLTTAQLKRLQKAAAAGKGCKLQLSRAQVKMMEQKGSGRFADYLRQGYNYAKPALRKGLAAGMSAAEKAIAKKAGLEGEGFFGDLIRSGAHGGIDFVADRAGLGLVPKKAAAVTQKGKGFFGDLARGVAHGGVDFVADHVGLGVGGARPAPARPGRAQKGKGFFGDLARAGAHGGIDFVADRVGLGLAPNPHANPNEALRGALFQKKVAGSGLRQ